MEKVELKKEKAKVMMGCAKEKYSKYSSGYERWYDEKGNCIHFKDSDGYEVGMMRKVIVFISKILMDAKDGMMRKVM